MYAIKKYHLLTLFCYCGLVSSFAQTVTIPVVVHIMHRPGLGVGFAENLLASSIQPGLTLLNAAFAAQTPFGGADCSGGTIQFCLAQQDWQGNPTQGYTRTPSNVVSANFSMNSDATLKSQMRWDPSRYLNIWLVSDICSESNCAPTAYAFSDYAAGSAQDGLVCEAAFWTTKEGAAMAAHELGHYFGLKHTYTGGCNNANCYTYGDAICDTPPDNSVFDGCGTHNSCGETDYNWNFMDANNWSCLRGFTVMQQQRMRKILETTRQNLYESKGCQPPCTTPATARIVPSATAALVGESLNFTINGTNIAQNQWFINNNFIHTNDVLNYTFVQAGTYRLCLTANNSTNCSPVADTIYIRVTNPMRSRLYVNALAVGTNTGITWQNAFTDLQSALVVAQPNTDIWVAQGTYKPSATPDSFVSFVLPDGVNLYGGFQGVETVLEDRKKCNIQSVLSGNLDGNIAHNSHCILKIKNLVKSAIIDNFEIRNAYSTAQTALIEHGGIFIENANCTIKNCTILENEGDSGAGLVIFNNKNATIFIEKTIFEDNKAAKGSAIWAENTNMKVENTEFIFNSDNNTGNGSIICIKEQTNGAYLFNHCNFVENTVTEAIISIENPANVSIRNTIIQKNNAQFAIMGEGADFSYSNISASQTPTSFLNCINTDPLFAANDYRLLANSPCIDAGLNTDELSDLSGSQRTVNNRTDIGCYEYTNCPKIIAIPSLSNTNFECTKGTNADVQIHILQQNNCAVYTFDYKGARNITGAYQALPQGTHYIKIYDANNLQCKDSARVVIGGKPSLKVEATVLHHACKAADNGVLMYTQTGGTEPFTATINGVPVTNTIISRLPSNLYTINIRDANNCLARAIVRVEQLPPLIAIAKTKAYNCDARVATLKLETSSGTVVGYEWAGPTTGYGVEPDSISGLTAGNYMVTITSSTGCSATTTARIAELLPITANAHFRSPHCLGGADGKLEITNVQNAAAPILYSINGGIVSLQPTFLNLPKGSYHALVEDRNNCKWERAVILEDGDILKVGLNRDTVISIGDSAFVRTNIQPTTAALRYTWSNTENLSCYDCATPRAFPLVSTTYTVTVTDDYGCTATDEIFIKVINNKAVFVPNVFTPNHDGVNDFLSVYSGGAAENVQLMRIYNRWGGLIFETQNFGVNNPFLGWNGTFRNESVDAGVYLYEVEVRFLDNDVQKVRGNVTLVRR